MGKVNNTVGAVKQLQARCYGLGDALIVLANRIDALLDSRRTEWSNEYLRTVHAEISAMARRAVAEDAEYGEAPSA